MKKKAVISISGGMDSTGLLLHLLRKEYDVHALSYNYGQKHSLELSRVSDNLQYLKTEGHNIPHTVLDLSTVMGMFNSALTREDFKVPEGHYEEDNMKDTVVPNRNAIFTSIAYGHALTLATDTSSDVILCYGVHAGDHAVYPDCRPEFYSAIEHAFKIGNWGSDRVSFYTPFLDGDKYTILKDAQDSCHKLGLDFDTVFANTNTCYQPNGAGESCGRCGSCNERIEAFDKLGVTDPVSYVSNWSTILDQARKVKDTYQSQSEVFMV